MFVELATNFLPLCGIRIVIECFTAKHRFGKLDQAVPLCLRSRHKVSRHERIDAFGPVNIRDHRADDRRGTETVAMLLAIGFDQQIEFARRNR